MTTPTPDSSGSSLAASMRIMAESMQALLHQQQTFANLPSSSAQSRQARQNLQGDDQHPRVPWNEALTGGRTPTPVLPTQAWLRNTVQSLVAEVGLDQRRQHPGRGHGHAAPPQQTPPTVPEPGGVPSGMGGTVWPGPGGIPGQWTPAPGSVMPGMMPQMMYGMMGMGMPAVSPTHGGASHGGGGFGGGHSSGGMGLWARANLIRMGARFGPWGAAAGAALAVGSQIPAEIRSQRDKNAFYQSVEGGSNLAGFGERLHEEVYRWSTPFMFSSEEARRAFKGVTKLGFNGKIEGGPGRQDALNFVYHGKSAYGATVDESLQELQVASKSALTNFKDLSQALKDVSDSAGEAGVNAQMARAEMTQLMDQAIQSGYGSSSTEVARFEQNVKNSYGRSFQDVDFSGRLSPSRAYMAASLSGMSVSEYLTGGAKKKGMADQKVDKATARAALVPGAEGWIKQQIAAAGGDVSDEIAAQIGEDLIRRFYPNSPYALAAVVGNLSGLPDLAGNPTKAATWLVQQYNGKGSGAQATKLKKADQKAAKLAHKHNQVQKDVGDKAGPLITTGPHAGEHWRPKGEDLDREESGGFLGIGSHASKAVEAYEAWHKKSGDEDPVIRSLLNAIEGDDKSKVIVSTKNGRKVVSLAEAVKKHRNELASGKAVIASGDHAGESVKDILGKKNIDPLRDFSKEAKRKDSSGVSWDDWKKKHSEGKDRHLTISLSRDARRLLSVMDSTGISGSAASAEPPRSPYPQNPNYGE